VHLLAIRTYDGSGQVVHPDIVRAERPQGRYWLALTPYPFSDEHFENPSIYKSFDGLNWEEPAPGVNPIVPRPPFDHNCDPDFVHEDGEFVLVYLETQRRKYRPDSLNFQNLMVTRSPDGIQWAPPKTVIHWELDHEPLYLSPSLAKTEDGWRLYLVDPDAPEIVWLPSQDLTSFGERGGVLETGIPGLRPWHVDVFAIEGGWIALVCARGPNATPNFDVDLWLGASPDLDRWNFDPKPFLAGSASLLDTDVVYRGTGLVENGRLAIWFSGRTVPGRWFVAVATFDEKRVRDLLR
jgi:hypothetical protein